MNANDATARLGIPVPGEFARRGHPGRNLFFILSALLFIIAGAVIGAGLSALHFRGALIRPGVPAERVSTAISDKVIGSVSLSPEEEARLRAVVEGDVAAMTAIRAEYAGKVRDRLVLMCDKVCEILGPERTERCGVWKWVKDVDWGIDDGGDMEGHAAAPPDR